MASEDPYIERSSEGGTAGDHSYLSPSAFLLAPATSDQLNSLTFPILPIACWRLDDVRFAFGSSFVMPETAAEFKLLADLREKHKQPTPPPSGGSGYPPISIFGHADPVGMDEQNKELSGRRATAIYGMLTRKVGLWEDLYSKAIGSDNWGNRAMRRIGLALGMSPEEADKQSGPQARGKMFLAYMDKLCGDLKLDPAQDFLAGGTDAHGKGDRQGCGEFNPILLFSRSEDKKFTDTQNEARRNSENSPNRRVVVLLFRPGSRVLAGRWPCPTVDQDSSGCRKRFWSDGEKRRSALLPDVRRGFETSHDTFACRFYHRLNAASPCEAALPVFKIRLFDRLGRALPKAPYQVTLGGSALPAGTADENGDIVLRNITVPVSCTVRWSRPEQEDEPIVYGDTQDDTEIAT